MLALAALAAWTEVEALRDDELDRMLYGASIIENARPEPHCAWIHRERSRSGVTLDLLHEEYLTPAPE